MSCLPSPRCPGRGQTSLPAVRAAAAPAAVGDVRGLRPCRGAPQAAQDDHLRALRRAATKLRARPVQPLHSRRPGSTVPIRRLDSTPDGHCAGLVARAHRVRRRPLSPRWRHDDPSKNRPDPHRGADRERAADPASLPTVDESVTLRALTVFFTGCGLALPDDEAQQRAAARRQRYLDAIPAPLGPAVIVFDRAQLDERDRDRRAGRRQLSDITLETRLRILRDLAKHLMTARQVTGWAEVTSGDLEVYLARTPSSRHQQTYVLRRFFGWAKRRKLILTNPTQRLRLGSQPGFTGTVLGIAKQRTLFRRWASDAVHPHERLIGLLALLHAASNAEIRTLTVTNVDPSRQTVRLSGRPFPTPLDPATWAALDACLLHRVELHTLNPHLVVTGVTRTRDTPADSTYLTRALASSGTTPSACRQTRLAQLVTDLDPKLTAAALGMHDTGLVRYLADNVDHDRIKPTIR